MHPNTRVAFDAYTRRQGELNNVGSTAHTFTVVPAVQQIMEQRIQESSAFLRSINIVGVPDLEGEKVGVGVSGTIAGRTDTTGNAERQPRDVTALDKKGYRAVQTDFDTALRYATLDAWARQPNFQTLIRDSIVQRQALDRMLIGFHGTTAAPTTDRTANPLLQDVNIGWLQQYRNNAPERVMASGKTEGVIKVGGADADYANLDALVMDAVSSLIDPWHRHDPGLVVILGRDLIHDKYFPMVNQDQPATEKIATDLLLATKRIGGLQPVDVPYMPDNAILITSLANLSLYWQIGGRRRFIQEQPQKNRVANFEQSNDAYAVEDYGLGVLIENIELPAEEPVEKPEG
jgi:P2 family phage major capsid protein